MLAELPAPLLPESDVTDDKGRGLLRILGGSKGTCRRCGDCIGIREDIFLDWTITTLVGQEKSFVAGSEPLE